MVTTRSGESTESPTKPTATASSLSTTTKPTTRSATRAAGSKTTSAAWAHTPSNATLIWLSISLPLVLWDAGYVLLRPHSMPGGKLHSPIWTPYALYAQVDYVYGLPAWESKNGWTATQTWFNVFETAGYLTYLYWVYAFGVQEEGVKGRGAPDIGEGKGWMSKLSESRTLSGKLAARAVVLGFSAASLTFFKTVMYWLLEYFSEFHNIGHNDWVTLVTMWIIPNGAWLIGPSYMMYVFGREILQGLEIAAEGPSRKTK